MGRARISVDMSLHLFVCFQAVEQYTAAQNAKIQRDDDEDRPSDDFDEHKGLIGEAMNEQVTT